MDENQFFREATLRICSSLNLQRAAERALAFIGQTIPADGLHIGLIDTDLKVLRILVHIVPDHWPRLSGTVTIPRAIMAQAVKTWRAEAKFGVINDVRKEDPEMQVALRAIFPEGISLLHTDLELESRRIGKLIVAADGRHRYQEKHGRLMKGLNEPFSIAVANTLQHQETLRLKEMLEEDNRYLHKELRHVSGDTIIGADFGLGGVMEMIRQVAPLDSPVLLLGETGTGKELLANALHAASPRRKGPFIKVSCGGLPESLLDSELFGHEQGAFTGATERKRGRFERAHGGTIFLDEIGELPNSAQVKLLRVLQQREFERVGGSETLAVDARIISATHRNLEAMVAQGAFREDLWFRLNVFPIMIPPLRQRTQDIPALIDYLVQMKCREMKIVKSVRLRPEDLDMLMQYPWPGNVRELQNQIERSLIQSQGKTAPVLRFDFTSLHSRRRVEPAAHGGQEAVAPFEQAMANHIAKALKQCNGKLIGPGGAAELLRLHPSTLRGKMRKLNLHSRAFKM